MINPPLDSRDDVSTNLCGKAQMCKDRAASALDAAHCADWLEMATHWRELAGDLNGQATLARLMHMNRIAL